MINSPHSKIIITSGEVKEALPHRPPPKTPGVITVLFGQDKRTRNHPVTLLAILTFIPFVNSWAWFRRSKVKTGNAQTLCITMALLLGAISCAAVFVTSVYAVLPKPSWIDRIDEAANSGVVIVETETGFGTGFVIAADNEQALIVTNKHVIDIPDSPRRTKKAQPCHCTLILRSGERIRGIVSGWYRDEEGLDLALILTRSDDLSPLGRIGRFDDVKLGDDILAIGHPDGLSFSLSRGTVERKWGGQFFQTSVPINQGNSGGPLLDRKGRVIGVNTFIMSPEIGSPKAFSIRADRLLQSDQWECCNDTRRLLERVKAD